MHLKHVYELSTYQISSRFRELLKELLNFGNLSSLNLKISIISKHKFSAILVVEMKFDKICICLRPNANISLRIRKICVYANLVM